MSNQTKGFLTFLTVMVVASLAMNLILLWQWLSFQRQAQEMAQMADLAMTQAAADLSELQQTTIQMTIPVRQQIPIKTEVPFKDTIKVPIHITIPIDDKIKTQIFIKMPDFGVDVPIDVSIPVKMDVPVNMEVPVTIDRKIPINTTIDLALDVPIALNIGETEFAGYIDRLRLTLTSFSDAIGNTF